ncbi:hypothetical protein [Leptospira kobayashii]|uniref:hypothetical protein n=1 Tax=Leptospira kobayashii TaxID=1917830 RepID=UPI003BFA703F
MGVSLKLYRQFLLEFEGRLYFLHHAQLQLSLRFLNLNLKLSRDQYKVQFRRSYLFYLSSIYTDFWME